MRQMQEMDETFSTVHELVRKSAVRAILYGRRVALPEVGTPRSAGSGDAAGPAKAVPPQGPGTGPHYTPGGPHGKEENPGTTDSTVLLASDASRRHRVVLNVCELPEVWTLQTSQSTNGAAPGCGGTIQSSGDGYCGPTPMKPVREPVCTTRYPEAVPLKEH